MSPENSRRSNTPRSSAQWTVGIGTMCSGGAILCEEACMIATIVSGILGVAIALMGYMMSQMGAGLVGYYTMGLGTAISATAAWAYMIPGGGSMMGEIIAASMLLIASLASAALPMGKG